MFFARDTFSFLCADCFLILWGNEIFFSIPVFRLFSALLKTELSRMSKVYSLFLHSIFDNFDRSRKLLFDFGRLPKFSDGSIHCRTLESVIGLFRPYSQYLFDVSSRKLLSLRSFLFERLRSRRSLWPIFFNIYYCLYNKHCF